MAFSGEFWTFEKVLRKEEIFLMVNFFNFNPNLFIKFK